MKNWVGIFLLLISVFSLKAQTMNNSSLEQHVKSIEDHIALKALVDEFSILADKKDVARQLLLFTEDAEVESFRNGISSGKMKGRKQIGDAFTPFLNLFETVYHLNGQQRVEITGDKATGVSYCQVTLIGDENGKKMKTTFGVFYHDEYLWVNDKWLIDKRKSNFHWQDKAELGK